MASLESMARDDLLGLALSLERALAQRCSLLVERLEGLGQHEEAGALQAEMAARGPGEVSVAALDEGRRDRILAALGWHMPEAPSPVTLYRALAWATESAEARFKLFGALGGRLRDSEARKLAEELAQAALSEAARLRRARRIAYRAERDTGIRDLPAAARGVRHAEDLRLAAREIETHVAGELAAVADARAERALAITKKILRTLGGAADDLDAPQPRPEMSLALNALDQAFSFYDLVQARARDEAILAEAQRLADLTVERLKQLEAGPPHT